MEPTRRGKIARLPRAIRQELNHRLDEGDPQKDLVVWLNSLPEVKEGLKTHFEGKPIREQNLSEWKKGGHRDWLAQLEAREIAHCLQEDAGASQSDGEGLPPLTDTLALWLATRLAAETRRIAEAEPEEAWKRLRQFSRELAVLRRGDLQKQRLELERQREQRKAERDRLAKKPKASSTSDSAISEAPDPDRPTRAERIAAARKAFFADVDNLPPINLPPRTTDPGYQPGISTDGTYWYLRNKRIPSPKDEEIRQFKAERASKLKEEAERLNQEAEELQRGIEESLQIGAFPPAE
jgi:hypothetical protein